MGAGGRVGRPRTPRGARGGVPVGEVAGGLREDLQAVGVPAVTVLDQSDIPFAIGDLVTEMTAIAEEA